MLLPSEIAHFLSPLKLSTEWGHNYKHTSRGVPAAKGRADRVIEASPEEEEGIGKTTVAKATDTHTQALPLLTWIYTTWHYTHPSIAVITAKAHRGSPSPAAQNSVQWVQWVHHFHDHSDPNNLFQPEEDSSDLESRELLLQGTPPITGWHYYILL